MSVCLCVCVCLSVCLCVCAPAPVPVCLLVCTYVCTTYVVHISYKSFLVRSSAFLLLVQSYCVHQTYYGTPLCVRACGYTRKMMPLAVPLGLTYDIPKAGENKVSKILSIAISLEKKHLTRFHALMCVRIYHHRRDLTDISIAPRYTCALSVRSTKNTQLEENV